jgi:hypothetical protein
MKKTSGTVKATEQPRPRDVGITWDAAKKKWLADGKVIPPDGADAFSDRRIVLGHGLLMARAERLRSLLSKRPGAWALAGWAVSVVPFKHPLYPEMRSFPIIDVRMEVYLVNCEEAQPGNIVTYSESLLLDDMPTNTAREQLLLASPPSGKTASVKKSKMKRPARKAR